MPKVHTQNDVFLRTDLVIRVSHARMSHRIYREASLGSGLATTVKQRETGLVMAALRPSRLRECVFSKPRSCARLWRLHLPKDRSLLEPFAQSLTR